MSNLFEHFKDGGFEVQISRDLGADRYSIFILQRSPGGKTAIVKPTALEFHDVEEFAQLEPSFKVSGPNAEGFLRAFAAGIAKCGVRIEPNAELEGELRSTKEHLRDMRDIVFSDDRFHRIELQLEKEESKRRLEAHLEEHKRQIEPGSDIGPKP